MVDIKLVPLEEKVCELCNSGKVKTNFLFCKGMYVDIVGLMKTLFYASKYLW